jgi:hypothetical protein
MGEMLNNAVAILANIFLGLSPESVEHVLLRSKVVFLIIKNKKMIRADNTEKRCYVACDEQTRKDGRCSCSTNKNQPFQIQTEQPICDRVNDPNNNRCLTCGVKAGHKCESNNTEHK